MKQSIQWHGIPTKEMRPYRKYINRELPGYCGTYVSAVMIHYMVQSQRQYSLSMPLLLSALKGVVDLRLPYIGTYARDLVSGMNELLDEDIYQAHWRYHHRGFIQEKLNNTSPLPIIVGTLSLFGSSYGNHWLLAYAYGYNSDGKLYYKCYDNHGKIDAVIPASQLAVIVWLERKEQIDKRI